MTKIWAMEENEELYHDWLGRIIISSEDENSGKIKLRKKLKVKDLGSFIKEMVLPIYTKHQISIKFNCYDYDPWQAPEFMGYVMEKPEIGNNIRGYISYSEHPHKFCLPIYTPVKRH